jgi:WD40 repeat protein
MDMCLFYIDKKTDFQILAIRGDSVETRTLISVPPPHFFVPGTDDDYSQFAFLVDGTLTVYNWKTQKVIWTGTGETSNSDSQKRMFYLTKKHILTTCPSKSNLCVWNIETGTTSIVLKRNEESATCIENIGDGMIALANVQGSIFLYRAFDQYGQVAEEFTYQDSLHGSTDGVLCMALVNYNILASSGWEKMIRIWNIKDRTCIVATETVNKENIKYLLPLGNNYLASCARDYKVNIWNIKSGKCEATLKGHTRDVLSLGLLGKTTILSGSIDGTIRAWTIKNSGKEITNMYVALSRVLHSSAFCDICIK